MKQFEELGIHQHDLTLEASQLIDEAISSFPDTLRVGNEAAALDWMEAWGLNLTDHLHEADETALARLDAMVAGDRSSSAVLISTGSVDAQTPPTPPDYLSAENNIILDLDIRRGVLLGAVGLSGYGFSTQQRGVIHNNMLLAESARGKINNASTPGQLDFHTEDTFFNRDDEGGVSPDVLALAFLRNREMVSTPIATTDPALLDPTLAELLRQPLFATPTSSAHDTAAPLDQRLSILFGDDRIRFNVPLMTGEFGQALHSDEAMAAMHALAAHIRARSADIVGRSGDILFINNQVALHAKGLQTTFLEPGDKRWQRRLATKRDLTAMEPYYTAPNSRVVDPRLYLAAI